MSKNNKGRNRWHGATPKTADSRNPTGTDPLAGWFSPAKASRISQHKRGGHWERR